MHEAMPEGDLPRWASVKPLVCFQECQLARWKVPKTISSAAIYKWSHVLCLSQISAGQEPCPKVPKCGHRCSHHGEDCSGCAQKWSLWSLGVGTDNRWSRSHWGPQARPDWAVRSPSVAAPWTVGIRVPAPATAALKGASTSAHHSSCKRLLICSCHQRQEPQYSQCPPCQPFLSEPPAVSTASARRSVGNCALPAWNPAS